MLGDTDDAQFDPGLTSSEAKLLRLLDRQFRASQLCRGYNQMIWIGTDTCATRDASVLISAGLAERVDDPNGCASIQITKDGRDYIEHLDLGKAEAIDRALGGTCDACKQLGGHANACPIGGAFGGYGR